MIYNRLIFSPFLSLHKKSLKIVRMKKNSKKLYNISPKFKNIRYTINTTTSIVGDSQPQIFDGLYLEDIWVPTSFPKYLLDISYQAMLVAYTC